MKYFGRMLGVFSYLIAYFLAINDYFVGLFNNKLKLEANLLFLIILSFFSFYILFKKKYFKNLVYPIFIITAIVFINLISSFNFDLKERLNNYEHNSDDLSGIITLPLELIILFFWGYFFDKTNWRRS